MCDSISLLSIEGIVSGVVGAFAGGIFTLLIYRFNILRISKNHLISQLTQIRKYTTYHKEGSTEPNFVNLYKERFPYIYAAFLNYRSSLFRWQRERMDRAWKKYKGTENNKWFEESMIPPNSTQKVNKRVDDFLEAIDHKK